MSNVIELGCFDASVSDAQCKAYVSELESTARVAYADIKPGLDKVALKRYTPEQQSMSVMEVQRGLKSIGFFPGGKDDGICGYRTQSAIRLFQEYVSSVEGKKDCTPDAQFGPTSQAYLREWLDAGKRPHWTATVEQWRADALAQGEYSKWLGFLEHVKQHYLANPNRMLEKVNAFNGRTDTRKVADWDFAPGSMHLIGIRRHQFEQRSDDVLLLLIKGLVFKFQGSTEPGSSEKDPKTNMPLDPPFLVQGQHHYHFGWHKKTYLALRPVSLAVGAGVLVVRSKDLRLEEADLDRELQTNDTINIHWGGRGMNAVGGWSHGCQVISGSVYIDDRDQFRNCSAYAANLPDEPTRVVGRTRGAYNVLLDLVTALGSDLGTTVKYMLLDESDLDMDPELKRTLDHARQRLCQFVA
ncbi:MAG: peptidoglycan-binding protein [Vicinamibacterales bacterium]